MNEPNNSRVRFDSIVKTYPTDKGGTFRALDNVSLEIGANEFFTLLGPSGCGKTTLLRTLAGFETQDSGSVWLDGADITSHPANKRPVNTVFQSYALFPHMSVRDNVGFGLRMLGTSARETNARAQEMLELVQMSQMANRLPAQLSGGQQQRIALARALAPQPKVLLLDEPLSALDQKLRKEMQIEMKRIQSESHTTFLFVTHDQEEALTMSDRIAVMSDGLVQQVGRPKEIYNEPQNRFVADFIGEMNFVETKGAGQTRGSEVMFDTAFGKLSVVTDATDIGHEPVIAIRPERFRLLIERPDDERNVISGAVENLVFTGPSANVHVVADTGSHDLWVRLSASEVDEANIEIGSTVSLQVQPENLRVLA